MPLGRLVGVIVEFLAAVPVDGVADVFGTDRTVARQVRDDRRLPGTPGIAQQRHADQQRDPSRFFSRRSLAPVLILSNVAAVI